MNVFERPDIRIDDSRIRESCSGRIAADAF